MPSQNTSSTKSQLVAIYRQALAENVPIDAVDAKVRKLWKRATVTRQVEEYDTTEYEHQLQRSVPAIVRYGALLVPITFISVGLFLLGNALVPFSQYYVEKVAASTITQMKSPIPEEQLVDLTPSIIASSADGTVLDAVEEISNGPTILDADLDYTNLANWFDSAEVFQLEDEVIGDRSVEYTVDIPKLDIKNAKVVIGGTDLNGSLIQYPGTAEPGNPGAPVIFGHSVLRQFYNPSEVNPRRYVSIFSTIMTLQPGDDIYITQDGVRYHYKMKTKEEVQPEDVYILTQNYDQKQLKLVTCTPEGTYLRRGVVTAELVSAGG